MFDSTGGENIEQQKGTWSLDKHFTLDLNFVVTSFGQANLLKKFNEITEEAGVVEEATEEDNQAAGSTKSEKQTTQKCDKWHCCHFYYKYCWLDVSTHHYLSIVFFFPFLYKIISI